jgi:uncharacterized membrane protein
MSVGSAQAFLSSITSGMLALTGIAVSFALVIVQFGSAAYSPRLIPWIGRDPILFHSFGMFIATFTYALATLAWTDRNNDGKVPFYSVMLVQVLLVASMVLLAQLVPRIGGLRIARILQFVGDKGRKSIRDTLSVKPPVREFDRLPQPTNVIQTLRYSGGPRVVVRLDVEAVVALATSADALVVFECEVGDTLVDDCVILRTYGNHAHLSDKELMRTIRLGGERTFEQDPRYAFRLLVDVAIRALSPAVNDPTTAVQSLDQIEDLLGRIGRGWLDSGHARDAQGNVRAIFPVPTWNDYVSLAFDEIRQYGATSLQVIRRLRSALHALIGSIPDNERADALRHYLNHLDASVETSAFDREDRVTARQDDRQGIGTSRLPTP